jgi:hypothetical protein
MRASVILVSSAVLFSCGAPLGRGFTGAGTCASGQSWSGGSSESELMQPGVACRACHLMTEPGKAYFFMGTAYASPHEADLCASDSTLTGAVVEILDTNDVVQLTLPINSAGNFRSLKTAATVPVPYKARVRAGTKTNVMAGAQSDGDCNSCHTAAGTGGAPGRVLIPQ